MVNQYLSPELIIVEMSQESSICVTSVTGTEKVEEIDGEW